MKSFFYKSKLLILIFCVAAFLMTLASASLTKLILEEPPNIQGMSDNFVIAEIKSINSSDSQKLSLKTMLNYVGVENQSFMFVKNYLHGRSIVYTSDYLFELNLLEGRTFTSEDFIEGRDVIIISEDIMSECEVKDNKLYFELESKPYEVIGIFEGDIGNMVDEIMYYVNMKSISYFNDDIQGIYYFDTKVNSSELFETIKQQLISVEPNIFIEYVEGVNKDASKITHILSNSKQMIGIIFIGGILIIMNAFSSSVIWIKGRKKEIGIRKMIGGQNYQIYKWIFIEYFKIVSFSFVIGIIPATILIQNSKLIESVPTVYYLFGNTIDIKYLFIAFCLLLGEGIIILLMAIKHFNKIVIRESLR